MEWPQRLPTCDYSVVRRRLQALLNNSLTVVSLGPGAGAIGAKPNLYCEAIELVCGGSPKICVLVERKSRLRVKSEG